MKRKSNLKIWNEWLKLHPEVKQFAIIDDEEFRDFEEYGLADRVVYTNYERGLMGMCVGILGGPIGMLLGGSLGSLTGMTVDAADAIDNASMIEQIAGKLEDGAVALIGLTDEEDEGVLDEKLSKYKTVIARFDAAVVAQEVDAAREMQAEMERQALEKLRKQKADEFKTKVEAHRDKMKAHFEDLKAKFK